MALLLVRYPTQKGKNFQPADSFCLLANGQLELRIRE
jgi:hypothetical protein